MRYYKEMTDYNLLNEQELEDACKVSSCCQTMGKNLFEGDVYYDCMGFGIRDCFHIKFCPFCGSILNKNTMDIDLVKYVFEGRHRL